MGLTTKDPYTGKAPSLLENFELGAAGLGDLAVKVETLGLVKTHLAADTYAGQVREQTGSDAKAATADAAASDAEDKGALVEAAKKTAEQVGDAAKTGLRWLPWVTGGVAAAYVLSLGLRLVGR